MHIKYGKRKLKCARLTWEPVVIVLMHQAHTQLQWGKKVFSQPPIVQVLCSKVRSSRKEDEEVKGDEPQVGV